MRFCLLFLIVTCVVPARAQTAPATVFTRADTLLGANTPQRAWWDAEFYDLHVSVLPQQARIQGHNEITYDVLAPAQEMQLDLQAPFALDSVTQDHQRLSVRRDGDAWFITLATTQRGGERRRITAFYHGTYTPGPRGPVIQVNDSLGALWLATSDEDVGASVWWPLKDYTADEPDSQRIAITVPDPLIDVSNGRLRGTTHNSDGTTTYEWFVSGPLNSYDVAVNAGANYVHFADTYHGEAGDLSLDFWPLSYHLDVAKRQFQQVKPMLQCFEHWFGPYPWYKDGYKLIETPYLGMEHQSGIAYGNRYQQGYLGRDLSNTGLGMEWDYIIVHESAHEWFGNSISAKDHADMWLHESFAMYAEGLYLECQDSKEAGERYLVGVRGFIKNDMPIIGQYGLHDVPRSMDRYPKGANMLLTMRQIVDDDVKWRNILRGLNSTFWHRTVTAAEVENYISSQAGIDLSKVFTQYLTTTQIPVLEYKAMGAALSYRWTNVIPGFDMPVRVSVGDSTVFVLIHPTEQWQKTNVGLKSGATVRVDPRFYVLGKNLGSMSSVTNAQ